MHKPIIHPTVLIFLLALSACSLIPAAPQPANSSPSATLSTVSTRSAPTLRASVSPYPTPTAAPSITPIASPSPQISVTPMPRTAATNLPVSTGSGSGGNPVASVQDCYSASVVRDVTIPDGTVMIPGQSFEKTWEFVNNGTCVWPGSFELKFIQGDFMQAKTSPIGTQSNIGKKVDASVSLVAPKKVGSYKGYFQLADKNGQGFGSTVFVSIVVALPTITPTPTRTPGP